MKTVSMRVLLTLGMLAALAADSSAQFRSTRPARKQTSHIGVRQVDHLLDSSSGEPMPMGNSDPFTDDGYVEGGEYPSEGGSYPCEGGTCPCDDGSGCCEPEYCGDYGCSPCYDEYCDYGSCPNYGTCADGGHGQCAGMCYAEVQATLLRVHVSEDVVGKLSEAHEVSPRVILGYEAPSGFGMRSRYWRYGAETDVVEDTNIDDVEFEFEVIDLEGTARFHTKRTDLVVAGGFRWADINIDESDDEIGSTMPGLTVAADARSTICCHGRTEWAGVAGARWSILGGDWEGDNNNFINDDEIRDDNVVVQELYAGVEFMCHHCKHDCYARIVLEMQNWRSDVLGESSAADSIGLVGPAAHLGIAY